MILRHKSLILMTVLATTSCTSKSSSKSDGPAVPTAPTNLGDSTSADLLTEKEVALDLALATTPASADGATPAATTLTIAAHDGATPVITDLWLYTVENGAKVPLTGFKSTAARKSPGLFLPATVKGAPSTLVPADDGRQNGLMSSTTRGALKDGAFVSTFTGTVTVTLPAAPTSPILVVAGVEDQRYGGAALINVDGTAGTPPSDALVLESHKRVSFTKDVQPLLKQQCGSCHNAQGALKANLYLLTGTADQLVNDNFGYKEGALDCDTKNKDSADAATACKAALNKAEFLVEPGAPALSDLLTRARPDEAGGSSANGLLWWGSKGVRYNATYGDRRMPSTTESPDQVDWTNDGTYFDAHPEDFQILFDWIAQGAQP